MAAGQWRYVASGRSAARISALALLCAAIVAKINENQWQWRNISKINRGVKTSNWLSAIIRRQYVKINES
jgi:hypothetical protein